MAISMSRKPKNIIRRIFSILIKTVIILFLLLLVLLFLIQTSFVQNFARRKIQGYLQSRLHTRVEIGDLTIRFPKRIVIRNLYLEDLQKDTLLAAGTIAVDISMLDLLSHEVKVDELLLNGITLKVKRRFPDTAFNYAYILKAFSDTAASKTVSSGGKPYRFELGLVHLQHVSLSYQDDEGGNDDFLYLGDLVTHVNRLDPEKGFYGVSGIRISDVVSHARVYKPSKVAGSVAPEEPEKTSSQLPGIELGAVELFQVWGDYTSEIDQSRASVNLGHLLLTTQKIDLERMQIRLGRLDLLNTTVSLMLGKSTGPARPETRQATSKKEDSPWKIELAALNLDNDNFRFDDESSRRINRGMDYSHLDMQNLHLVAINLSAAQDDYKVQISRGSMKEKSGLDLRNISAVAVFNGTQASLQNFIVRTDRSSISGLAAVNYNSLEQLTKRPGDLNLDVNLGRSLVSPRDLLLFVPALDTMFRSFRQSTVQISGKINGRLRDLSIHDLEMDGLGKISLSVTGRVQGLPDYKRSHFDLDLKKIAASRADLENLLPRGTIPAGYHIPEQFLANGHFTGTVDVFSTKLAFSSSQGGFLAEGSLDIPHKVFSLQTELKSLDLGYLLGMDSLMGKITLDLTASGEGFDYKTMRGDFKGTLEEAMFKGYDYKNLDINGSLNQGMASWHAAMKGQDAAFTMQGDADIRPAYPSVKLKLQVDTINFRALHLMEDSLSMRFNLVADLVNTNPDSLDGNLNVYKMVVSNNQQHGMTDSISFHAQRKDSVEYLSLHSELENIVWLGVYKITEVPLALKEVVNHYYNIPGYRKEMFSPEHWQLNAQLWSSPLVLAFLPGLKGTDSVDLSINLNSAGPNLELSLQAPKIQYENYIVRDIQAHALTRDSAIRYRIQLVEAGTESLHINQSSLAGWLTRNDLFASLLVKDKKSMDRYHIAGTMSREENSFRLSLEPDSLLLNYDKWSVARDNFIRYDSSGLIINDLKMSNMDQSLGLNSTTLSTQAPVQVSFSRFRLKTISSFMNQDSLQLDGLLNGTVEIRHLMKNPAFTSDLRIDNLAYDKDTVGNLMVKIDNIQGNTFNTNVALEGPSNHVQVKGVYYAGQNKMDMQLNVGRFDLALIKAISKGQISRIHGSLSGNLNASGDLTTPVLAGTLRFDSTSVTPFLSGEPLRVSAEKITFSKEGINLGNLDLLDSAGNKTTIEGNLFTRNFMDYRFDLTVKSRNFRLVNVPKETTRMFYGKLNLDADMKLTGDLNAPKINADLRINKQTNITMILPSSDPEEVSREGVVLFWDKSQQVDTARIKRMTDSLSRQSELKGMEVTASIETDSSAQFNLVIDERNGDVLGFRGRADLAGGIDKSGKMTLTGNYELDKGSYNVSLSVLKRKFDIQRGSTLTWTGSPTKASIDITALYQVNAPPIDLVQQDISSMSQDEINRFKQKLPFRVNLIMKGELLKPEISFEITLPDYLLASWPEVANKLQQMKADQSEVNKQVFALLLLNRFVEPNPFASAAGSSDAALIAKQSVSGLLSEQLNQLAGSLIKGVDVSVDMTSDQNTYTGSAVNQTEMNVNVSKKLFNERVSVNVGSNFQLEEVMPGQSTSNIAGDVSVEYKLSKDGRYAIRVFRKDQYNTIVEGQVVETGLSFVLTFDYNKFRELFQKQKHKTKPVKEEPKNETPAPKDSQ